MPIAKSQPEVAVRTLVTTSRMPFAVDEIRKLGETGQRRHRGRHVQGVARQSLARRGPSHRGSGADPGDRAVHRRDRRRSSTTSEIEWLLPMFEEVFYLAAHRDRLEGSCELFFPDFPTLAKVHDKVSFAALCRELGLPVAESVTATSPDELTEAIGRFDHWFARAAYGRGGLNVLTNTGPLAGEGSVDDAAADAGRPVAGAGVPRRRRHVQLERRARRRGRAPLDLRARAHHRRPRRHRVRVGRRTRDARGCAEDRRRAGLDTVR